MPLQGYQWGGRASAWARCGLNLTTKEPSCHTHLSAPHLRALGSSESQLARCRSQGATPGWEVWPQRTLQASTGFDLPQQDPVLYGGSLEH